MQQKPNNLKPCFVVFEGLDGCGKTTISKKVAENLGAEWMSTPPLEFSVLRKTVDDKLTDNGLAVQAFYASTVIHASEYAKNILARGESIVIDRYVASTLAYDKGVRNSGFDDDFWINRIFGEVAIPNLTFYMHATSAIRQSRMKKRAEENKTDLDSIQQSEELDKRYQEVFSQLREKLWEITKVSNESTERECVEKCMEKLLFHRTKTEQKS